MSALDLLGLQRSAITVRSDEQKNKVIKSLGTDLPQGGCGLSKFCGQATKGAWWMPWQKQAMKVVASCDKPRGAASRH
jgi:hypothetical protein